MLMRHFRPAVAEGICYGVTDLDLAEGHEDDLRRVMQTLPVLDAVITSPLRRCRVTAEAIAAHAAAPLRIDTRLAEMDFGAWEGCLWDVIPREELDEWAADFLHARPHGGESVAMLRARVQAVLEELSGQVGNCLVLTHAGVIKAATAAGDAAQDWPPSIAFGSSVTLRSIQSIK